MKQTVFAMIAGVSLFIGVTSCSQPPLILSINFSLLIVNSAGTVV